MQQETVSRKKRCKLQDLTETDTTRVLTIPHPTIIVTRRGRGAGAAIDHRLVIHEGIT